MEDPIYNFSESQEYYRGKVRDVYKISEQLVMVVSDRISAFDHILPRTIPYKGQVLNQLAAYNLHACKDIVPVWLQEEPLPNISLGKACQPIKLEMVIRGYLAGHAWRTYNSGQRTLCGEAMPNGLHEGDPFPEPIITPATKAEAGHDEDISKEKILQQHIVSQSLYEEMEYCTRALYKRGQEMAKARGLILVDTKYEFGLHDGKLHLIDEIHTPDSSRYYILDGYEARQAAAEKQEQLSKEFVREWLISQGFQGLEGQQMPEMDDAIVEQISTRYIDLYERLTGQPFIKEETYSAPIVEQTVVEYLKKNKN